MSYRTSQSTYPYFCINNNTTTTNLLDTILASNTTFFNNDAGSGAGTYSNGKYTAPVKGLYYIEVILNCVNQSAANDDSGEWGIAFKQNSTDSVESTRHVTDNPGDRSTQDVEYVTRFSTILQLNAGGYVRVYSSGFTEFETYLSYRNYFMGYLIAEFI